MKAQLVFDSVPFEIFKEASCKNKFINEYFQDQLFSVSVRVYTIKPAPQCPIWQPIHLYVQFVLINLKYKEGSNNIKQMNL